MTNAPIIGDDRLARLPMLTWPAYQLFPGTLLPVHVTSAENCAVIERCLERGERSLVLAALRDDAVQEDWSARDVFPVMGAGVILAAEQQENGSWNVIIRGTDRVRMVKEFSGLQPYREVQTTRIADVDVPNDHPLHEQLRVMIAQLAERAPQAEKALTLLLGQSHSAGQLTNLLASHTVNDPYARQLMLDTLDVAKRLEIAITLVDRMLSSLGQTRQPTQQAAQHAAM